MQTLKNFRFIIVLFLFPLSVCFAQQVELKYGLISNELFFLSEGVKIKEFSKHSSEKVKINQVNALVNSYFPFAWNLHQKRYFAISAHGEGGLETITVCSAKLTRLDSLEQEQFKAIRRQKYQQDFPDQNDRIQAVFEDRDRIKKLSNPRGIPVIAQKFRHIRSEREGRILSNSEYVKMVGTKLSFDLYAEDTNMVYFYCRDDKDFSIWKYQYPPIGKLADSTNWTELITYTTDTTIQQRPVHDKYFYLPGMDQVKYNAVRDTSFFLGHFKVILQNTNRYCINLKTGAVYILLADHIEKIAQIDITNYFHVPGFGRILIENRDEGSILVFSKIRILTKEYTLPNFVELADKKTIEENFPYKYTN